MTALRWGKRRFQHLFHSLSFSFFVFFHSLFLLFDFIDFIFRDLLLKAVALAERSVISHTKRIYRWQCDVCDMLLFASTTSSATKLPSIRRFKWKISSHKEKCILYLYGINNNNKKSVIKVNECARTNRNYVSECFVQANHFFGIVAGATLLYE